MRSESTSETRFRKVLQAFAKTMRRTFKVAVCVLVGWLIVILIGLLPVNRDFTPTPDAIEILVISNEVHADLIMPVQSEQFDWRQHFSHAQFTGDVSQATHVAIGWGDKGFFINTPTWDDLTISTAARALFVPSDACLHVKFVNLEQYKQNGRLVEISLDQYEQLTSFISSSFEHDDEGRPRQIRGAAYGTKDAFFEAEGSYHGMNTCNCWVGRALKSAGVKVGVYTPLPKSVFLHLPEQD